MRERPALFSGEMVRRIIDGSKTNTRRVVQPMPGLQSRWLTIEGIGASPKLTLCRLGNDVAPRLRGRLGAQMDHPGGGPLGWVGCPYDADRLWVREAWAHIEPHPCSDDDVGPGAPEIPYAQMSATLRAFWARRARYRADADEALLQAHAAGAFRWRPGIHMPRWASRLTLDVLEVRVERLQSMSEEDARAEGVTPFDGIGADQPIAADLLGRTQESHPYTLAFAVLWDEINGLRPGCSWAANPWVWSIEFRTVERALMGNEVAHG